MRGNNVMLGYFRDEDATERAFAGGWFHSGDLGVMHPDGYLEVHTFSVDSEGNLYGGDNQYGRTQKFVPKKGADPAQLIKSPWVAR